MNQTWIKYLPWYLRNKLDGRQNLQRIIGNTGWLFIDKVIRMGIGLFISVWIARYLGPEQFGLFNYAVAFVALFSVIATLGLEGIVVRNIVQDLSITKEILGTAFTLKFIGGLVTFFITISVVFITHPTDNLLHWLVGVIAAGTIFQSFDIIDFWFQSQVLSKYTVYAKNAAFLVISLAKVILIIKKSSLIYFAWASLAEVIIGAIGLIIAYRVNENSLRAWSGSLKLAKQMLMDSWPLILSGIVIMIYMRIDQIMLGELKGDQAVGIYSATIRLSEVWYFIPMVITSSIFPATVNAKKNNEELYLSRLQKLFNILTWLSVSLAIFVTFFSDNIIQFLYGNQYIEAGNVLKIHIWTGVFVFLGVASSQYLITENLTKYAFYRTASGAVVNIILNLFLIPKYGAVGAAVSTLISQFMAAYLFDISNKSTKIMFVMKTKSLFFHQMYSGAKE